MRAKKRENEGKQILSLAAYVCNPQAFRVRSKVSDKDERTGFRMIWTEDSSEEDRAKHRSDCHKLKREHTGKRLDLALCVAQRGNLMRFLAGLGLLVAAFKAGDAERVNPVQKVPAKLSLLLKKPRC